MESENLPQIKTRNLMAIMQDYFTKKQPKFIKRDVMDMRCW